jgi:phage FluMu protein Com
MILKCFYCGRLVKTLEKDGKLMAKCTYPRCKLQPETDWEETEEAVREDWEMIRESLNGNSYK